MTSQPPREIRSEPEGSTAHHAGPSALEIEQYTIAQIPTDRRHGRPRDLFTMVTVAAS